MPTTITFGIASYTDGDYLDNFSLGKETEVAERRGTNGQIKKVQPFNPTSTFKFDGGGDPAVALGVAELDIEGVTGGIQVVMKYEHAETNVDFDSHTCEGKHYPNAA
jgi:hypothetical protein